MKFTVEVVKGRQLPCLLQVEAPDVMAARRSAVAQGWTVLDIRSSQFGAMTLPQGWPWFSSNMPDSRARSAVAGRGGLVIWVEQLHALLSAGLSVIEALDTLQRGNRGPWHLTLIELNSLLRQGCSLSNAMDQLPVFPELLVALVRSAEQTSNLPQALARFLEHEERAAKVRHQIISVALYPSLLLAVGGGVLVFLLLFVMPRFAKVFESMSHLPWSAELMVAWSHLLRQHGGALAAATGATVFILTLALSSRAIRAQAMGQALRMRPLAHWMRIYYLARWYRTIGMLVEGGIPLPDALELARRVLPLALQGAASATVQRMREGLAPSLAFGGNDMATPVAEQLIKAGERSGDVGAMLQRAAAFHELEVTKALDNSMRIIEPLVMTLIGLGVGVIVILMYLPIFELASAIQ